MAVESLLTHLLRRHYFLHRPVELEALLGPFIVAELYPARQLRTLERARVYFLRYHGHALAPFEATLAHVGSPGHRIAVFKSIVHDGLHLLHRHILIVGPQPVVGHLQRESLVERMVSEARNTDIVVGVELELVGKRARSVLFAIVGELLGQRAEVSVEDAVQTLLPGRGIAAVGVLQHTVEVARKAVAQLIVRVFVFPVVQPRVSLFRHQTVVVQHIDDVPQAAALGEVYLAVHAQIFVGLVVVAVAHREHLAQVKLRATLAHNLVFNERCARERPACARLVLVLHRTRLHRFHVSELKALHRVGVGLFGILRHYAKRQGGSHGQKKKFFHDVYVEF